MRDVLIPSQTLKQIRDNFAQELKQAASGKKTSLAFIPNPLPRKAAVKGGETFQVLVIGGSIFETAIGEKRKGKIVISHLQKAPFGTFATENDLFSFIFRFINTHIQVLGLNFAFPVRPVVRKGRLDGIYIGSAEKQHGLVGLRGKLVGKALERYLKQNKRTVIVTIGHDLLYLGLSALQIEQQSRLVCGIVGTGCNFGFFRDSKTLINTEAGRFNKFDQTETGKIIDAQSKSVGKKRFEKEVSGLYLYQHFNLLSSSHVPLSSTEELSRLASDGNRVAQQLIERSASLVACQIDGIYRFKGQSKMTFVMEGSLFGRGWCYREMVNGHLEKLDVPKGAIKFLDIENSAIRGAAALVS